MRQYLGRKECPQPKGWLEGNAGKICLNDGRGQSCSGYMAIIENGVDYVVYAGKDDRRGNARIRGMALSPLITASGGSRGGQVAGKGEESMAAQPQACPCGLSDAEMKIFPIF